MPPRTSESNKTEIVKEKIKGCTRCHLYKKCLSPIPFEGPVNAPLLIIGEAPGAVENQRGRPFVGPAGKLLRSALRETGFDTKKIMFANTISCFPYPGRTPTKEEIEICKINLRMQYKLSKARYVLLLGNIALQSFKKNATITATRGKPWKSKSGKRILMAAFHPSYVLRDSRQEPKFRGDLSRLLNMMKAEELA